MYNNGTSNSLFFISSHRLVYLAGIIWELFAGDEIVCDDDDNDDDDDDDDDADADADADADDDDHDADADADADDDDDDDDDDDGMEEDERWDADQESCWQCWYCWQCWWW